MAMTLDGTSGITQMTGSIVMSGSTSGTTTIIPSAVAGTTTVTMPAATGTMMVSGNMPAFHAYANTTQSISSATQTLANFGTKVFDTAGCFNNTGSTVTLNGLSVPAYAFCPNVAGYYQIISTIQPNTTVTRGSANIYKNGSVALSGNDISSSLASIQASGIISLNGTGDYVQMYALLTGVSPQIYGASASINAAYTLFQAILVRSS